MRAVFIIITVFFLFVLSSSAQEPCNRHAEPTVGYSMCVPAGWTVETFGTNPYKLFVAPRAPVFTPNINFRTETLPEIYPLRDYVALSVKKILASTKELGATSIKLIDQSDFAAGSLKGVRLRFVTEFKGITIASWQYMFVAKDGKKFVIVTCTGLDSDRTSLDALFDRTAKTFQLDG